MVYKTSMVDSLRIPRNSVGIEIWKTNKKIIECITHHLLEGGKVIFVCEPIVGLVSLNRNGKMVIVRRQVAFAPGLLVLEKKLDCFNEYYVFLKDAWGKGKYVEDDKALENLINSTINEKNPVNLCKNL